MTHRCHNREFLLKFARDRDDYRDRLREHLTEFEVALLDYCIICNHVHLRTEHGALPQGGSSAGLGMGRLP